MEYSCIIELVGVKELAEDNPKEFLKIIRNFKNKIEEVFLLFNPNSSKDLFNIYNFRDYCYIQSNSFENIISYAKYLRSSFFRDHRYFFKVIITIGSLELEPNDNKAPLTNNVNNKCKAIINHIGYNEIPSRLYGIAERFKGVGFFIDIDKIEQTLQVPKLNEKTREELNGLISTIGITFFNNFYISNITSKKVEQFLDCRIDIDDEIALTCNSILSTINRDRAISKKLARFYLPLLINLAENIDASSETEYDTIEKHIGTTQLSKLKDIAGIELFYYTIINKYFADKFLSTSDEYVYKIQKEIGKINWLVEVLRDDSRYINIPKAILNQTTKRNALREIHKLQNTI